MEDKQAIVFAFYKDKKLIGYRQDTMGSIGNQPKIYHYSREQVETVVKNVEWNLSSNSPQLGRALRAIDNRQGTIIANALRQNHRKVKEMQAFEMHVLECPEYEYVDDYIEEHNRSIKWPIYPHAAMEEWKQYPEKHVSIEVHYFSLEGKLNLQ